MKKITLLVLTVLLVVGASFGSTRRLFGFAKWNCFAPVKMGDAEGIDFTLARTHQALGGGLSLMFGSRLNFGLEVDSNPQGTAWLEDPSDNDRVAIYTIGFYSIFLRTNFAVINGKTLKVFIDTGAGVSMAKKHTTSAKGYMSENGAHVYVDPPEELNPFTWFAGIEIQWFFSKEAGLMLNTRYQSMNTDIPQKIFVVLAGFVLNL